MVPRSRVVYIAIGVVVGGALTFPTPVNAIAYDFVSIGNAGNAPHPNTGLGSVAYEYAIGKTEVTNAQYAEFLNAVDPQGFNELELFSEGFLTSLGGGIFQRLPSPGEPTYFFLEGRENLPVSRVSWFDAIRFANWMHNGRGDSDTESGAYTLEFVTNSRQGPTLVGATRNADARFWLPTEDEWFKAAHHDAQAGTAGVYFEFATGSNEPPISDRPEDNPAAVNFQFNDGQDNGFNEGFAILDNDTGEGVPYNEVGAYTAATSSYGTFDQNGNVIELLESLASTGERGRRGGSWNFVSDSNQFGRPIKAYP